MSHIRKAEHKYALLLVKGLLWSVHVEFAEYLKVHINILTPKLYSFNQNCWFHRSFTYNFNYSTVSNLGD